MNYPKLSIITPSFNQGIFLERTIQSVLNQNYPNLEYFVIDGGSSDQSVEIIKKYDGQLSGWVSEKDDGQADAIRKGVAMCSGDVIAWINSDDFYLDGAFFSCADVLVRNPGAGLVFGDLLAVDAYENLINVIRYQDMDLKKLMCFEIIGQPSVFFRRECWDSCGGISTDFHYLLDHHLWLRMAKNTKLCYCPRPWAVARYHADAKNLAQADKFGDEAAKIALWLHNDPDFGDYAAPHQRAIESGATRIGAYYLALSGQYRKSLQYYAQAFGSDPRRVLKEWRSIALTVARALSPIRGEEIYQLMVNKRLEKLADYRTYLE